MIALASASSKVRLKRKSGEVEVQAKVIEDDGGEHGQDDDGSKQETQARAEVRSREAEKQIPAEDKDGGLFRKPTIAPGALRRAGNTPPRKARKGSTARSFVEDVDELEHATPPVPDDVQDWAIDEAVRFCFAICYFSVSNN